MIPPKKQSSSIKRLNPEPKRSGIESASLIMLGCAYTLKERGSDMLRDLGFIFLFFIFLILWLILWLAVHITAGFVHILIALAIIFLIIHFVRRPRAPL